MCLIVVGSHFANFGQNSQQFSLGSFLLQPPSTLQPLCNYAQNSIETLLLHLLKYLLKHFLKRLHWDDNIIGIYWTSFVGFYYKDCIYWNIFEPHKVIEYVEKYDKNKKCFFSKFTVSHNECQLKNQWWSRKTKFIEEMVLFYVDQLRVFVFFFKMM